MRRHASRFGSVSLHLLQPRAQSRSHTVRNSSGVAACCATPRWRTEAVTGRNKLCIREEQPWGRQGQDAEHGPTDGASLEKKHSRATAGTHAYFQLPGSTCLTCNQLWKTTAVHFKEHRRTTAQEQGPTHKQTRAVPHPRLLLYRASVRGAELRWCFACFDAQMPSLLRY